MEANRAFEEELPNFVAECMKSVRGLQYLFISITFYSEIIVMGLVSYAGLYLTYRLFKNIFIKRNISQLKSENQDRLAASAARLEKYLEDQDPETLDSVVKLPWDHLVDKLQSGELTAVTVLLAYLSAALAVQSKTNAVVAWIEEALDQAKQLDTLPKEKRGPLHGVPVSIKECYDVSGYYSTAGITKLARTQVDDDCPVVKMIKKLGGVPFCKTNVPQMMISLQCSNPVYGVTENPHKAGREAGGSSGGEGALVGGGGSILGVGSDVGGSLRNPPAFCGAYSLKPTEGRHLSQVGVAPYDCTWVGINVVGGWIAGSARALEAAWRSVWTGALHQVPADNKIVPLPWNEETYKSKPRIGYFTKDGYLDVAPGCARAVTEAVKCLETLGYTLVPIQSPDIEKVLYFFNGIILADENKGIYKHLDWDVYDSTLSGVVTAMNVYKLPSLVKKLLVNPLLGLFTKVTGFKVLFSKSAQLASGLAERDKFRAAYLEEMDKVNVDLILCPGQMLPSPPTGTLGLFVAPVLPYIPWNVLNFPAGIAPFTKWTSEDTATLSTFRKDDLAYKYIHSYSEGAEGLPIAVQVVGRPYKDEQVLRIITELDNYRKRIH